MNRESHQAHLQADGALSSKIVKSSPGARCIERCPPDLLSRRLTCQHDPQQCFPRYVAYSQPPFGWGIYLDATCGVYLVESNLVYNTLSGGLMFKWQDRGEGPEGPHLLAPLDLIAMMPNRFFNL